MQGESYKTYFNVTRIMTFVYKFPCICRKSCTVIHKTNAILSLQVYQKEETRVQSTNTKRCYLFLT